MARKLLWTSLALAPATLVIRFVFHGNDTVLFVLAAASLVPLAWLIGEATEQASEHTGPGVGGFLNASFGNAPELIIALFAIGDELPNVVRGSIAGSIVSNLLLVLGVALIAGRETELDRRSLLGQLGLVLLAVAAFLVPSVPGFHGDPERHALVVATVPVAVILLVVYLAYTAYSLRRHRARAGELEPRGDSWSLGASLGALAVATVATALVSEVLVHSLDSFAKAAGLSEFFISIVIVAIVGNAAEHGGAVVIARRGKMKLATEIAVTSSAQVGLLVAPAVALLSLFFAHPLPLAFRPVELGTMAVATAVVAVVAWDGRSRRWEGGLLVTVYAVFVLLYLAAGNR